MKIKNAILAAVVIGISNFAPMANAMSTHQTFPAGNVNISTEIWGQCSFWHTCDTGWQSQNLDKPWGSLSLSDTDISIRVKIAGKFVQNKLDYNNDPEYPIPDVSKGGQLSVKIDNIVETSIPAAVTTFTAEMDNYNDQNQVIFSKIWQCTDSLTSQTCT